MHFRLLMVVFVIVFAFCGPAPSASAGAPRALALSTPAFAASAAAGSFLDTEAGLAAYFYAGIPINMQGNQLRNVFRSIETEAPNYIIGSVPLAGYSQSNDVRVFVHASGWVVAYYPRLEPASKVLDFEPDGTTTITTRFDEVLASIAAAITVSNYQVAYYDFRYPAATHLLLVGESRGGFNGTVSFQLNVPSSLPILERSWYAKSSNYPHAALGLDGVTLGIATGGDSLQGFLPASQLVPDAPHTVSLNNDVTYEGGVFGGLAFVY